MTSAKTRNFWYFTKSRVVNPRYQDERDHTKNTYQTYHTKKCVFSISFFHGCIHLTIPGDPSFPPPCCAGHALAEPTHLPTYQQTPGAPDPTPSATHGSATKSTEQSHLDLGVLARGARRSSSMGRNKMNYEVTTISTWNQTELYF